MTDSTYCILITLDDWDNLIDNIFGGIVCSATHEKASQLETITYSPLCEAHRRSLCASSGILSVGDGLQGPFFRK